jgi:hypothetical protein
LKNVDLDELEQMRKENEYRLKELQEAYYGKRENATVGKVMRERMGFKDSSNERRPDSPVGGNFGATADFERDEDEPRTGKPKKSVKIVDAGLDKENHADNERVPRKSSAGVRTSLNGKPPSVARGRSRSASRKEESPVYDSPR